MERGMDIDEKETNFKFQQKFQNYFYLCHLQFFLDGYRILGILLLPQDGVYLFMKFFYMDRFLLNLVSFYI